MPLRTRLPLHSLSCCAAIMALGACSSSSNPARPIDSGKPVARLEIVSGGNLALRSGETLQDTLVVRALDADGHPVPGATINWALRSGAGQFTGTTQTDADGRSRNVVRLNRVGVSFLQAAAAGVTTRASFRSVVATHPEGTLAFKATIGEQPFGAAVSDEGLIGASQVNSDQVAFIDSTGQVVGQTSVGNQPVFMSFAPNARTLYVANRSPSNSAMAIDVDGRNVVTTFAAGWSPFGLIVDQPGERLYVADDDSLHVYQVPAGLQLYTIPLGDNSEGLAFDLHGKRLYLGTRSLGKVLEVNVDNRSLARSWQIGGRVQGVAVMDDSLYAVREEGSVAVIDLKGVAATSSLTFPYAAYGATLTPDRTQLWISHLFDGKISIVDVASRTVVRTLDVGGRPRVIAFSPTGTFAAIANESGWVDIVR